MSGASPSGYGEPRESGSEAAPPERAPTDISVATSPSVFPLPAPPEADSQGAGPGAPLSGGYRSLGGRARAARLTLLVIAFVYAIAVVTNIVQFLVLSRIEPGQPPSQATLGLSDSIYAGIGVVQFVLLVAGAITVTRWLWLAYANLPALGHRDLRFRQASAY